MMPSKLIIITDPFVDATDRKLLTRTTFVLGVITLLVLNQLFMFAVRSPLSSSSSSTILTGLVWNVDNDPESSNDKIQETRNDNNNNNESPPFSWLRNASSGIPKSDMGQSYISFGICCYQQAQRDTQNEYDTKSHNHGEKRYDKAVVMSADLWKLKEPTSNVVVTLAYVGTDESSIQQLQQVKRWLYNVNVSQIWEYDVSNFTNPSFACVRVAQMGRMYLHESNLLDENDFVFINDADVFPINTTNILQYLTETNLDGDYYRVTLRDFHSRVKPNAKFPSIKLALGVGQTIGDYQRSFEISGLPTLKDAVDYTYNLMSNYTWGTWFADQTIFTYALMNSELCYFPSDYIFWKSNYQGQNDLLRVNNMPNNSTTTSQQQHQKKKRDEYTCFKQNVPHGVCFEKYENETGYCTWAHFSAKATFEKMYTVYKAIADDIPGVQRAKTTIELFGEETQTRTT